MCPTIEKIPCSLSRPARLEILPRRRALLDLPEHLVAGRLDPHQDVEDARLAVEVEDVAVADDIRGADRGEEVDRQPPGAHRLQEGPPPVLEGRRVLVGEGDEVDPVGPVQPLDFVR